MSETDKKHDMTDALSSHLLGGKKHHDEDKNVETEEIKHLEKGADYLTTLLLQQGVKETKTKAKKNTPKVGRTKKNICSKSSQGWICKS